jgi:H+/gluconate symporter-like permease
MGLIGILIGLALLIWLALRGWSVLLLARAAALLAAAFVNEPLLANWTQTFMNSAAAFLAQFFPLFGASVVARATRAARLRATSRAHCSPTST